MIMTYAIFPMELQIDMTRNCRAVPVHPVLKEFLKSIKKSPQKVNTDPSTKSGKQKNK